MEKKMDLRIQKTYLALHNAFTELLEKKRFEDFTVNELCDRAMIRRTTFYKHFADKYDYFSFYMKEVSQEIKDDFSSSIHTDDMKTYMLEMIRGLLKFMNEKKNLVNNVMQSNMFSMLFDMLTELVMLETLLVLRRTKNISTSFEGDLEGVAAYYAGGVLSTIRYYYQIDHLADEEKILQTISNFLPDIS